MTFSSDGTKFPSVPHIEDDEKAFGTRTPNTSPGKQLQALVDRTELLLQKLGLDKNDINKKTILDLLLPLSGLLDDDGKLPINRLLATDDQGNLTTIAIPSVSFTRVAVANFSSNVPQRLTSRRWIQRTVNGVFSTKPTGIQDDWVITQDGSIIFNSPGQYQINVTAIGAMVDAHQLRINVNDGEGIFNGILTQTASAAVSGHTMLTATAANAAFTLGVQGAPSLPTKIAVEHWCARGGTGTNPIDVGFASTAGSVPLYLVGTIVHTAIQTLKINDARTVITDFNT